MRDSAENAAISRTQVHVSVILSQMRNCSGVRIEDERLRLRDMEAELMNSALNFDPDCQTRNPKRVSA